MMYIVYDRSPALLLFNVLIFLASVEGLNLLLLNLNQFLVHHVLILFFMLLCHYLHILVARVNSSVFLFGFVSFINVNVSDFLTVSLCICICD